MLADLPPVVSPNKVIDELHRLALDLIVGDKYTIFDLSDLACDDLGTGDCIASSRPDLAPTERMAVALLRASLEINRLLP
jgi:hypothetical protein